jgi:type IV pilus assembly protein PilA
MLKKIRKMLKKQEGFTLIELMVAVIILGILAGVGVQQYNKVIERAKDEAHQANRRVLLNAAQMYVMLEGIKEERWTGGETEGWVEYLQEWPKYPKNPNETYVVTFTPDGSGGATITVEPED